MEPPSTEISIVNDSGVRIGEHLIHQSLSAARGRHPEAEGAVGVLLTTDECVRALNGRYRGLDEATDVLSFSGGGFAHAPLGDIAIAVPYASRQAALREATVEEEVAFLAIHGFLHLCGFEDEDPESRMSMVEEMNAIAKAAGMTPDIEWHSRLRASGGDL